MKAALVRVILYVQDVDRLAAFYRDALGLPVVEEIAGEWAVLQAGACELALHRVGEPYRVADTASWQAASNAKLVLAVDQPLEGLRAALLRRAWRWARSSPTPAPDRCVTAAIRKATCSSLRRCDRLSWFRRPP